MGAIFNLSFDLIGLKKIELFLKICEIFAKKFADFWKKILGLLKISLWKNYWLGKKFALLLLNAKCYPRQNVIRQNVTQANCFLGKMWLGKLWLGKM